MPDTTRGSETPETSREPHPKELSSEYHKAHKQLMLWSMILFVWEFVGIDLEEAKKTEGYAGALVKSIKSPHAVPWVLLVVVVYFTAKCSIEWAQCHVNRRKMRFARVDFLVAWLVALIAISLYGWQSIKGVQFADRLVQEQPWFLLVGLFSGSSVGSLVTSLRYRAKTKLKMDWVDFSYVAWGPLTLAVSLLVAKLIKFEIEWSSVLSGCVIGALFSLALSLIEPTGLARRISRVMNSRTRKRRPPRIKSR